MAGPDLDNLSALLDDAKCFALVRQHRWPDGVCCPACASSAVIRDGCDDRQRSRQRYRCKACSGRFDDLTGTVLAGHHQPLRVWVLCLYLIPARIAADLFLHPAPTALDAAGTSQRKCGPVLRDRRGLCRVIHHYGTGWWGRPGPSPAW